MDLDPAAPEPAPLTGPDPAGPSEAVLSDVAASDAPPPEAPAPDAPPPEAPAPDATPAGGDGPAALGRLLRHAGILLVVLAAAAVAVGSHGRYSADESAVTVTVHSLAGGHGWLTPHPLPEVDRTGAEYPLVGSQWGEKGVSAYAKHPAYPAVLQVAERAWPGGGPVVVSILGTVLAALLAAVLAARIAPGAEVATLWLVGVASPLFIDAQLLMAHTLAAAAGVAAVLLALRATDVGRSGAGVAGCIAGSAAATAATVLFRSEGLFLAGGLALAFALRAIGPDRVRSAAVAGATAVAGVAAFLVDRAWQRAIIGAAVADPSIPVDTGSGTWVAQRLEGLVLTMVRPSYGGGPGSLLLVLVGGLLALALFAALRSDPDVRAAAALCAAAGGLALVRALVLPTDGVPGFLIAFPLGWVGVFLALRSWWGSDERRIVGTTVAAYLLAVAATQYAVGGGVEWGGRYFALCIPLVAPLAVAGFQAASVRFDHTSRRIALAGLATVVLGVSILGLRELRHTGSDVDAFFDHLPVATQGLGPHPVVVTTDLLLPRLAGRQFTDDRWLLVRRTQPNDLVARLRRAGVKRFVLITGNPALDRKVVAGARKVGESTAVGWRFVVYET